MTAQQSGQILKDEIKQMHQQIDQLKVEIQEGEALVNEKNEMFQEASDTIEELKQVNSSLQLQIQVSEQNEQNKNECLINDKNALTNQLQGKITELTQLIEEKSKREAKLNKKIELQKASIKEWQQNSKKVYKDLKRNEIL